MTPAYEELFEASLYIENDTWTQDTLAGLPTCKGVLLFTDRGGSPIQLLQAANCRRTAQAKLRREDADAATRKADVSDLTCAIYYTCCYNPFLSQITYTHLAHAVFGNNAGDWIQLPSPSLAVINTDAFLPYFYMTDTPARKKEQTCFGLFATRKAAAQFCEILNTVFVLCRNPALLKTGREPSCPYLQMQTCPGPCLHPEQRAAYADAVDQALQSAAGNIEPSRLQFQEQMQHRSKEMDFEQAQRCKKKIEQLSTLARPDYQWVHPLDEFCLLHIDTGPKEKIEGSTKKIQQLMWFKITARAICHLGNCTPVADENIKNFLETRWTKDEHPLPAQNTKERMSLVSLNLFRSQRSGLWIDCTSGLRPDEIIIELQHRFGLTITNR